jgi:tetratricopeptide (TPR) repeat protein
LDLPGWQAIYQQLKANNFEIISVAEDTGGVKDAGKAITDANPTYTVLIDQEHLVSKLYNMVNVPTGVWISEEGKIVRPNEVAFVDDKFRSLTGLDSAIYLNALKDWAEKGGKSAYVMSPEKLQAKLGPPDANASLASAEFGLGEQLYKTGHLAEAIPHFKEAQRLNPKSWNYKRQAYKLSSESDYGTTFAQEVQKAGGGKVYYATPDLPKDAQPKGGEAQEKKP